MIDLAQLCRALGLGDDPRAIIDRVKALYAEIDGEVEACAQGTDLPCRAGCDACCHESVFLSAPELLLVAEALSGWSSAQRASLIDSMGRIAAENDDDLEMLEVLPPGEERDEVAARVRFRCPFLDEAGMCRVYAARELNARTFGRSRMGTLGQAYGCSLTHERLRVIGDERGDRLFDAREARRRLAASAPGTERVHVYPWWFAKYGALMR
jgi:hypothetical protein